MNDNKEKIKSCFIKSIGFLVGITTGWIGYEFITELTNHLNKRKAYNLRRIKC